MRPLGPAALALGCSLGLLVGTAPASAVAPLPQDDRVLTVSATPALVTTRVANTRISRVLATRTESSVLGKRFTMTVWDTASGTYIYKRRATTSLRGASTTKILTSVGVLATLGPDHRLPTAVRAGSSPDEVVLVAGGDPLLSSAGLRTLAARTAAALGVPPAPVPSTSVPAAVRRGPARTITVRADDSLFSGSGHSRGWPSSYLPSQVRPVGAFARDDNKVRDATADAGKYFASALGKLGVSATYAGEATAAPGARTVASIPGHSVAQAVSRILLVSDNDTAEMLFRHIAVARGLPGTWAGARQGLADTLRELRIPLTGVRIIDGSGLSLEGRLTAGALTSALARALSRAHPELAQIRVWLPVAGRTGTLGSSYERFSSRPAKCAAGLIQAKTGTVADSIALAGYANGADGRTKIFVSIVNSRPTQYTRLTTRKAVDRAASSVTGCW